MYFNYIFSIKTYLIIKAVFIQLNFAPVYTLKTTTTTTTETNAVENYVKISEYVTDQGKNLTLPCGDKSRSQPTTEDSTFQNTMWIREGRKIISHNDVQIDGSLVLRNVTVSDAGLYICSVQNNADTENDTMPNDSDNYQEYAHVKLRVRTVPGPVATFSVRASTIIAVIVWEVWPNRTGGYAIRDFTAEYRKWPDPNEILNVTVKPNSTKTPYDWERLDPNHISPNARQLEIYHLTPNTTYEFRIWANNQLGSGEIMTVMGTTTPKIEEKDLIRRIMIDAQNFDTRWWIGAVGVVMGTLIILTLGTCIVLYKECRDSPVVEEELDLELVPNIILNPGYCDSDNRALSPPMSRIYGDDDDYNEPMNFSRKLSIFFTGNTIKRI